MVHQFKLSSGIIAAFLFSIFSVVAVSSTQAQISKPVIEYNFPMDGSKYVPGNTPIIFRPSVPVSILGAAKNLVVTGTLTGRHQGCMVLSDDNRTIIFTPTDPFESGDHVTVTLGTGIQTTIGSELSPISFSFDVQDNEPVEQSPFLSDPLPPAKPQHAFQTDSTLPADFPVLPDSINNNPSPGYLFLSTFKYIALSQDTGTSGAYRMVLDKNGSPVYYQHAADSIDFDFQPQPNGLMTYFELPRNKWFAMDSTYKIVDSFWTQPPYTTDLHDLELLTHGHALMLSYYPIKPYNLAPYGGSDTATFIGCVIEETDSLKQPVWIWRSWDPGHFLDTDATEDPITEKPYNGVQANSIQVDTDGNILLSSRELDEATKISRKDGHLIWRLGGKHNQFTFINDTIRFSHQNAVRRIANGHITLFDNGNFNHIAISYDTISFPADTQIIVSPPDTIITPAYTQIDTNINPAFARACEYNVDTATMTATLVWHYDHDSTIASQAMGYVQRLPDGNTLISWGMYNGAGGAFAHPAVTEVTPDKKKTFEMYVIDPTAIYRAFKFPSPNYDTGFVAGASPYILLNDGVVAENSISNAPFLGSPYPNPSNGSSMVGISATLSDRLELSLYDPLGRLVRNYFSGFVTSPSFSLELLTNDLPNGAYDLVLRGDGGTVNRQLVILR